jgi:hypothetical protein
MGWWVVARWRSLGVIDPSLFPWSPSLAEISARAGVASLSLWPAWASRRFDVRSGAQEAAYWSVRNRLENAVRSAPKLACQR